MDWNRYEMFKQNLRLKELSAEEYEKAIREYMEKSSKLNKEKA